MHDLSFKIEQLIRQLDDDSIKISFCNAGLIDVHPLAALTLFFGTLYYDCDKNNKETISMICDCYDEISVIIGNRKITESFNFDSMADRYYISGNTNREVISSVIEQMKKCYHAVYGIRIF